MILDQHPQYQMAIVASEPQTALHLSHVNLHGKDSSHLGSVGLDTGAQIMLSNDLNSQMAPPT